MISADEAKRLARAQASYAKARERVWVDRIGAGLAYRRALREIEEKVRSAQEERDRLITEAVRAGGSYREVAGAIGLSHSRVQQIVGGAR